MYIYTFYCAYIQCIYVYTMYICAYTYAIFSLLCEISMNSFKDTFNRVILNGN